MKNWKKLKQNFFKFFNPQGLPHSTLISRLRGGNLKNPLMAQKYSLNDLPYQISCFHHKWLGCRVWWVRKWHIAFYNPSEPVDAFSCPLCPIFAPRGIESSTRRHIACRLSTRIHGSSLARLVLDRSSFFQCSRHDGRLSRWGTTMIQGHAVSGVHVP